MTSRRGFVGAETKRSAQAISHPQYRDTCKGHKGENLGTYKYIRTETMGFEGVLDLR